MVRDLSIVVPPCEMVAPLDSRDDDGVTLIRLDPVLKSAVSVRSDAIYHRLQRLFTDDPRAGGA